MISIIIYGASLYYSRVLSKKVQQQQGYKIQESILKKRNKSNLEILENESVGDFLTIITEDIDNLSTFFSEIIISFAQGLILFNVSVIIGLFLSYKLTIIILLSSLVSLIIPKIFSSSLSTLQHMSMNNEEEVQNFLYHNINAIPLIKAYQNENIVKNRFVELYNKYSSSLIDKCKKDALMVAVNISSGFTISTIWFMIGIFMIFTGDITFAGFTSFLMLSDYFNFPFFNMTNIISKTINKIVSYERINTYINNLEVISNKEINLKINNKKDLLNINEITFKYKNSDRYQLTKFSESIKRNEKIALIGESGHGKSTLSKIIMGLYEAENGNVIINIRNKYYSGSELTDLFSYVPQKNIIFNGSVKENILIGNVNASEKEIIEACKIACAYDFIVNLPDKFDTIIGKSSNFQLSEGQIQRLALARALVKKCELFIFDEFTSAIDEINEKKIIDNLKSINKTMLFIAHKEKVINNCDRTIII